MRSKQELPIAEPVIPSKATTRRSFLGHGAALAAGLPLAALAAPAPVSGKPDTFLDLLRLPDEVTTYERFEKTLPAGRRALQRAGGHWHGGQVSVESSLQPEGLSLSLAAPSVPIVLIHVRWRMQVAASLRVLADAWERSYGELGWRNLIPERVMPWYFATSDGNSCHGYGVQTGAASLCFWQLDPDGVSLWLNVANGGNGVALGSRTLTMAKVVSRRGQAGESSVDAVTALCHTLCARPSRPILPVYGVNDWNYSYGHSTAESILRDTEFLAEVSPSGGVRPFSVIDEGWHPGTPDWPDMAKLAADIVQRNARPGLWIRPLRAPADTAQRLLLPDARFGEKKERARELAYDPTHPEAQQKIRAQVQQVVGWKYEMVKHDFSSYDLLGQWGFEMGPQPTLPGWPLYDRSRTNAEVISGLYALLRQAAGPQAVLDGCNTVGHLGQGLFDVQRTGDDTSGRQWERTRRMGVNTLAFRLPQQGTFYTIDADQVGITDDIPWDLNRQWLAVLARSGAATIVSPGPPARGQAQRAALREAFALVAAGQAAARPIDWMDSSTPEQWQSSRDTVPVLYHWSGSGGASAFLSS